MLLVAQSNLAASGAVRSTASNEVLFGFLVLTAADRRNN
jgi:hypothetical protein